MFACRVRVVRKSKTNLYVTKQGKPIYCKNENVIAHLHKNIKGAGEGLQTYSDELEKYHPVSSRMKFNGIQNLNRNTQLILTVDEIHGCSLREMGIFWNTQNTAEVSFQERHQSQL